MDTRHLIFFLRLNLTDFFSESRIYDINVYNDTGICICSMHRMELRKVSTALPVTVDKRYELTYQPVVVDVAIQLPEVLDTYEESSTALYCWLDRVIQDVVVTALASNPQVALEVNLLTNSSPVKR